MRIGLYCKPQNDPIEEHCGQHTKLFLQSYTTAPPAWRQRSHRKQLPRKEMAKHTAVECRTHLRMRRWCEFLMERADDSVCHVRFSHTFVGADVGIGPYKPVSNIRTISYRESIGLAPE